MNDIKTRRHKVFISWKGNKSKLHANAFYRFLERMGAEDRVFYSSYDVNSGAEWRNQIFDGLRQSKVVVAFVTKENVDVARWVECEVAAVWLAEEGNLAFPFLVDLDQRERTEISSWGGPFSELQFLKQEFVTVNSMLKRIGEECGINALLDDSKLAQNINVLLDEWKALPRSPSVQNSVLNSFSSDEEFAEWAYEYHRIPHHARDLTVLISDYYAHLTDPDAVLTDALKSLRKKSTTGEWIYESHPAMDIFEGRIKDMLEIMEDVFTALIKGAGAKIWICLRDLRGDNQYHNFLRSTGFPGEGRDAFSVAWQNDCNAIKSLRNTTTQPIPDLASRSGRNCTIITDTSRDDWPPSKEGFSDPHRKQSMLGAVLLKKTTGRRLQPDQGLMWWVLCVNSDKPGVFNVAHQRLLQGCNDAFSSVANALLRASHKDEV